MKNNAFAMIPSISHTHDTTLDITEDTLHSESYIHDSVVKELIHVYDELANERKRITQIMASVKKCFKKIEKKLSDEHHKQHAKQQNKSKHNGLTKPFPISTVLCSFMSVPEGTHVARAEVTRYLHKYIKEKGLYDTEQKNYFKPDSSLQELLNLKNTDEPVHIFSIQKKMNSHFNYTHS